MEFMGTRQNYSARNNSALPTCRPACRPAGLSRLVNMPVRSTAPSLSTYCKVLSFCRLQAHCQQQNGGDWEPYMALPTSDPDNSNKLKNKMVLQLPTELNKNSYQTLHSFPSVCSWNHFFAIFSYVNWTINTTQRRILQDVMASLTCLL
jgi:hypothetical protein